MPKALYIVPLDDNKTPDLQAQEGETLAVNLAETKTVKINDWIVQADTSIPDGYDEIVKVQPGEVDENGNPTEYRVMAIRSETVPKVYGGHILLAPARGGLPIAIVLVASSQAKLDVLNTRLRALNPNNFYGRIPLSATAQTRTNIADKLGELAAHPKVSGRPGVIAALEGAATATRAITLANWKREFRAVLGSLFQLDERRIDKLDIFDGEAV